MWSGEHAPTTPRHPQAHTCCRVYGSDTKAVSNHSSLPRESQTPTPHAALTVLERGPLGPGEGKAKHSVTPLAARLQPPRRLSGPRGPPPPSLPTHPKMTAFHTMMLFSEGAPLTPAGGSSCSLRGTGTVSAARAPRVAQMA